MSLEMIIGLVILLVVAGVIIAMLLHFLNPDSMPSVEDELQERGFSAECKEYCDNRQVVEYCSHYFGKDEVSKIDLNKNAIENDLLYIGAQKWPACESRVYCFLHTPCMRVGKTQREVIEECANLLCDSYMDKYDNSEPDSTDAVLTDITISSDETECEFVNVLDKDNWFEKYFPNDVCGVSSSASISVTDCVLDKTTTPWSYTCDTNCVVADSVTVRDSFGNSSSQVGPVIKGGKLTVAASFKDIKTELAPEVWSVILVCRTPNGMGSGVLDGQ